MGKILSLLYILAMSPYKWFGRCHNTLFGMILGLIILLSGAGCHSLGFYQQAVVGQWKIERAKKSIPELQKDPDLSKVIKVKFNRIQQILHFAAQEMKLPTEGTYSTYVALERDYVVWNVVACPKYSLTPHRWWYPLLGKLSYRGYFEQTEAQEYAKTLERRGFDVALEGVVAFSTLGWFSDPIFDTFVDWPDIRIAELLFHELAHRRVFLKGQTEWNEAFAVVTAREGVKAWLVSQSRYEDLERYEHDIQIEENFISLVLATKKELEKLYASFAETIPEKPMDSKESTPFLTDCEKSDRKQEIFDTLRQRFDEVAKGNPDLLVYNEWINKALNNAHLRSVDTYYSWVPTFEALHQQYMGNWEHFFKSVEWLERQGAVQKLDERS
ncbi:MAG: aminopeptidase [Verrucomicrobiota bacterium]|nr:aminopeptidase [Verrucomicrobiota bacterium]